MTGPSASLSIETTRLLSEAFDARLAGHRARGHGLPHLADKLITHANRLSGSARSLEITAQEISR